MVLLGAIGRRLSPEEASEISRRLERWIPKRAAAHRSGDGDPVKIGVRN
jgi:hypothetical protein